MLIARAIASDCPILALDEPTSGLDLHNQVSVLSLLRSLAAGGITILLTTHHPDHARFLADRVVLMGPGYVRAGTSDELLTDDERSGLYDVEVRPVSYPAAGGESRAIITTYYEAEAGRASRGAAP